MTTIDEPEEIINSNTISTVNKNRIFVRSEVCQVKVMYWSAGQSYPIQCVEGSIDGKYIWYVNIYNIYDNDNKNNIYSFCNKEIIIEPASE